MAHKTKTPTEILDEIAQKATQWRIGHYVIAERYHKDFDPNKRGFPHPAAKTEPIYRIQLVDHYGSADESNNYSKSTHDFIMLSSPSNRTDEEILDTSFTLAEAYEIVNNLMRDHFFERLEEELIKEK